MKKIIIAQQAHIQLMQEFLINLASDWDIPMALKPQLFALTNTITTSNAALREHDAQFLERITAQWSHKGSSAHEALLDIAGKIRAGAWD